MPTTTDVLDTLRSHLQNPQTDWRDVARVLMEGVQILDDRLTALEAARTATPKAAPAA